MGEDLAEGKPDERAQFDARPPAAAAPAWRAHPAAPVPAARRWPSIASAIARAVAREEAEGTGFVFLPVLLIAGALTYFVLPGEPPAHAVFLALPALAAAAFMLRRRVWPARALVAALVVACGMAAGKFETFRASTPMLGSAVTTRVTGRLVSLERRADGRVRLILDVLRTERPALRHPPRRVRLTARGVPDGLGPGNLLAGLARLMPPSGPVYPGGYDFSFESYFDGIGAIGFFMRDPGRIADAARAPPAARLAARLQALREAFAQRIRARIGGAEGEVAVALITGLRAGMPDDVTEALRRAGLAHVLAISGLHMALVAFTVMTAMRIGYAFFPGFASRHPVKKHAAVAALGLCLAYLFISGAAVAASRSFIMLAVMLAALLVDRAALTMRNLAIAALIVVAVAPHEVVGPSFQMSFAATAALIAGYAALSRWRRRRPPAGAPERSGPWRLLRATLLYIGGIALTSLIAGLATALYGAWHFQRVSPLGLGANLAAMPVVSILVMPSAVAAVLAMPFGLDGPPLALMGKGIAAVIAVAGWISERTRGDMTGLVPAGAVIALSLALILATLLSTRLKLLALPFLGVGLLFLAFRELPDVLISEDGRLAAFGTAEGDLAVDRARANRFAADNWRRALGARSVVAPVKRGARASADPPASEAGRFSCDAHVCRARHPKGALIATVRNLPAEGAARQALFDTLCPRADLLLIIDATVEPPCAQGEAHTLTLRHLARRGSAAIYLSPDNGAAVVRRHAVRMPWRPWHVQRRYSRAARGLAPRRKAPAPRSGAGPAGSG